MSIIEYPQQLESDTHVVELVLSGDCDDPHVGVGFFGPRREWQSVFVIPEELRDRVVGVRLLDLTKPWPDLGLDQLFPPAMVGWGGEENIAVEELDDSVEEPLLPCPCCGAGAEYRTVNSEPDFGATYIECVSDACRLTTALVFACGDDPEIVLRERWNRRV